MDAPSKTDDLIPTRESLLTRLKDWRDGESWREFFDSYWRLIYNTARQAGLSDAESQDIVQETIISVAKRIEGFKYDPKVCSFKTWMLNLTRWRIINQLKRRQRQTERHVELPASDDTDQAAAITDPASVCLDAIWKTEWERSLLAAAAERVKRQVSPEQFQLFDLYCIEGWPVKKVAQTLGVSATQVYLAKHRIGRLMKKQIELLQRGENFFA